MYKVTPGPVAFFDVDDTLLMWDIPKNYDPDNVIDVKCRNKFQQRYVNIHNLKLLETMAMSGHAIVVWSAGGSDWAEAAVKALNIESLVDVVTSKPTYFIDDISDPSKILGKYGYFDIDGNRSEDDYFSDK